MGNEKSVVSPDTDLEFDEINFSSNFIHKFDDKFKNNKSEQREFRFACPAVGTERTASSESCMIPRQQNRSQKLQDCITVHRDNKQQPISSFSRPITRNNIAPNPNTALKLRHEATRPAHFKTIIADPARSDTLLLKPNVTDYRSVQEKQILQKSGTHSDLNLKSPEKKQTFTTTTTCSPSKREMFPAPPGFTELSDVDLSHLDPKEMAAILEVAARAQEIDQLENRKVRNIQKQVESFSNKKLPAACNETQKTENKYKQKTPTNDASLSRNQTLEDSKAEGGASKGKKKAAKSVEIHKKHPSSDAMTKSSKSTLKGENSEKKANTELQNEMRCSMCSKVTSIDASAHDECSIELTDEEHKERCYKINELKKHLKCSSCCKFICKSCASSSVLAKKGGLLCQLCLKRRELAAHEWLSNKCQTAPLFRSASAEIPSKIGSLSKTEAKSSDSKKLSLRSRSYSGSQCSSSASHKISGTKELETRKESSDLRTNEISTSEALVRRLSQDELVQKELRKNKMERNALKVKEMKKAKIENIAEETETSQKEIKTGNNVNNRSKQPIHLRKNKEQEMLPSVQNPITRENNITKEVLEPTLPNKVAIPYLTELKRKLSFKTHSDLNIESTTTIETSLPKQEENVSINSVHALNRGKDDSLLLEKCDPGYQPPEAYKKSIMCSILEHTKPGFTKTESKPATVMSVTKPTKSLISISESQDYVKPFPRDKDLDMELSQIADTSVEKDYEEHKKYTFPTQHQPYIPISLEKDADVVTSIPPTSTKNEDRLEISQKVDQKAGSCSQPSTIGDSASDMKNCEDNLKQPLITDVTTESRRSSIDEERSGIHGTLSVSSYTESEGPAEWSVDELDDGDTFFLVTSTETNGKNLPPGISGSSTLHSASSDEGFTHSAMLLSGSDAFRSSFEIVDEENDTEGDFDDLLRDEEDKDACYVGGLKRAVPFPDLSLVKVQNDPSSSSDRPHHTDEVACTTTTHTCGEKIPDTEKHIKAKADESSTDKNGKNSLETQNVYSPAMSMFKKGDNEVGQEKKRDSSGQDPKVQGVKVKDMIPGETFFKTTNCDIDFSEEENPKPVLRKSFPVKCFSDQKKKKDLSASDSVPIMSEESKKVGKCKPVPAKRTQPLLQNVPTIMISNFNECDSSKTASTDQDQTNSSTSKPETTASTFANKKTGRNDVVVPEMTKPRKTEDSLSRSTGKSPYINKFGSKVIQTPSGTKLPISPLAKKVHSNENVSENSVSKPIATTGKIWAIQGATYFDTDSGSGSTDSEEEIAILQSATTSSPVYPEDMKKCDSSSLLEQKEKPPSFFFRRTASTDNFEELLKKTTETPRPRRAKQSLSTSNGKKTSSLYAERQDSENTEASWGRSISLSPPNQKDYLESQALSSVGRRNSESAIFDEVRNRPDGYLHFNSKDKAINHTEKMYSSSQPSYKNNVTPVNAKDAVVLLSKSTIHKDISTSPSFCGPSGTSRLPSLARCVSCGVLSQFDDSQTTTKALSPSMQKDASQVLPINKPAIESVNSSTQVTPEKEKPPSSLASFDICQLTALIQAFKDSSDHAISGITSREAHTGSNEEKIYSKGETKFSPTTAAHLITPITREPSSTYNLHKKPLTINVSTETCLDGEPIVLPRDKLMTSRRYVTCCHYYDEPLTRFGKVDIGVDTRDINRDLVYHSPEPFGCPPRDTSFHRNLEKQTNRSSCYDLTNIRGMDGSLSYHNPSSYYHKIERRFPHLPDPDYYAMMENRLRSQNFPVSRWARSDISRQPYDSYYQYHNKPEVDAYQPHSMNYNMELEDGSRAPYHPSPASIDSIRCFSKPNLNRFQSKSLKVDRSGDYEQQMQLDNLRDIYENEVPKVYAEEIEMRRKTVSRRKERDCRRCVSKSEKKEMLQSLPNGNFSLRRSASVPTVVRSELQNSGLNGRHDNIKTQNMDDHVGYLSKDSHPLRTYRENKPVIDENAGFSDRYEQHNLSNEALLTHEDLRADFQSGFSTESSTGTSLSSGAYYISPPTSPGHRKSQNLSSFATDNRYGYQNARSGYAQTTQMPKVTVDVHQPTAREADISIRKSARPRIKLPQPPEEDEFRARYHTNKRYNAYPPLRNRSKFSDRSEENMKREVNQLRQTMEDLDQEEKELDMKLRYLELGRISKTSSVASLSGSAFQSHPASLVWENDKTVQNDPSKFRFFSASPSLESSRIATRNLLESRYVDKPLDDSRDNNDAVTFSFAQNRRAQRNFSEAQQQHGNYVIVNDVSQIISEKDKEGFKDRHESLEADTLEYTSRCQKRSSGGKDRKRFSETQDDILPKCDSPHSRIRPKTNENGPRSRSTGHVHRRDACKHGQSKSVSRGLTDQDHHSRQEYTHLGRPTSHKRCSSQSPSRSFEQRSRRNDDASKNRYKPSDDRIYHANYVIQDPSNLSTPWIRMQNNPLDYDSTLDNANRLMECKNGLRLKSKLDENRFGFDGKNCPSEKSILYTNDCDKSVRNIYEQIEISKQFANKAKTKGAQNNQSVRQDEPFHSKKLMEAESLKNCKSLMKNTVDDRNKSLNKKRHNQKAYENKPSEGELPRNESASSHESKPSEDIRTVVSDTEEYHLRKEPNGWFDKPQHHVPDNPNSTDYAHFFEH